MTDKWKMYFIADDVRAILSGECPLRKIIEAFVWYETPEGHDYWNRVYNSDVLDVKAGARLEEMLAEYEQ